MPHHSTDMTSTVFWPLCSYNPNLVLSNDSMLVVIFALKGFLYGLLFLTLKLLFSIEFNSSFEVRCALRTQVAALEASKKCQDLGKQGWGLSSQPSLIVNSRPMRGCLQEIRRCYWEWHLRLPSGLHKHMNEHTQAHIHIYTLSHTCVCARTHTLSKES